MVVGPDPEQRVEHCVVELHPHGKPAKLLCKLFQLEISVGQDSEARSDLHILSSVFGLGLCYGYMLVERRVQRRSKRKGSLMSINT